MFNMLGVRLDPKTDRLLASVAKRRGTTKSAVAREAIHRYLVQLDLAASAREQSLRAAKADELEAELPHDDRGWTG